MMGILFLLCSISYEWLMDKNDTSGMKMIMIITIIYITSTVTIYHWSSLNSAYIIIAIICNISIPSTPLIITPLSPVSHQQSLSISYLHSSTSIFITYLHSQHLLTIGMKKYLFLGLYSMTFLFRLVYW